MILEGDHRRYVANTDRPDPWAVESNDASGKAAFELLKLVLRPEDKLLDFGCGSLRVGRWIIPYLEPKSYFGIEPNKWLVEAAQEYEIPEGVWEEKSPQFDYNDQWELDVFNTRFNVVLVSDVFVHAADWQIEKVIRDIGKVADTGVLNIFGGPKHYEGMEWVYPNTVWHEDRCVTGIADLIGFHHRLVTMPRILGQTLRWFILERDGTG